MDNLALFCKTYKGDFDRFKILKSSIDKYNFDKIPFYIVCPQEDIELFSQIITQKESYKIKIIADEEVLGSSEASEQSWYKQQLVKMNFYKQNIAEFYLVVDSDSYFIKEFCFNDFMYDEKTPYVVMHEGKDARLVNDSFGGANVYDNEMKIKKFFRRKGLNYRFLTTPIIFSSVVLSEMAKKYDFSELLAFAPVEAAWHGEFLLNTRCIPFCQCEPFFKAMVYADSLNLYQNILCVLESDIARNYFGIVMQANHTNQKKYKSNVFAVKLRLLFLHVLKYLACSKKRKMYRQKIKAYQEGFDKC